MRPSHLTEFRHELLASAAASETGAAGRRLSKWRQHRRLLAGAVATPVGEGGSAAGRPLRPALPSLLPSGAVLPASRRRFQRGNRPDPAAAVQCRTTQGCSCTDAACAPSPAPLAGGGGPARGRGRAEVPRALGQLLRGRESPVWVVQTGADRRIDRRRQTDGRTDRQTDERA